jgi:hypothetical protein
MTRARLTGKQLRAKSRVIHAPEATTPPAGQVPQTGYLQHAAADAAAPLEPRSLFEV